jgi:hypothetical protein
VGLLRIHSQDPTIRKMILLQNFIDRMLVPSLVNSIRYSLRYFSVSSDTHFLQTLFDYILWSVNYLFWLQVFENDIDMHARDIEVHS